MSIFTIALDLAKVIPRLDKVWDWLKEDLIDNYIYPLRQNIWNLAVPIWNNWADMNKVISWINKFDWSDIKNKFTVVNRWITTGFTDLNVYLGEKFTKLNDIEDFLSLNNPMVLLGTFLTGLEGVWVDVGQLGIDLKKKIDDIDLDVSFDFSGLKNAIFGKIDGSLGGLSFGLSDAFGLLPTLFMREIKKESGGVVGGLIHNMKDGIGNIRESLGTVFNPILQEGVGLITNSFTEGSPDEETLKVAQKMVEVMFARMEELSESERDSFPEWEEVRNKALVYSGLTTAVIFGIQALGVVVDATQPVNGWGVREGLADLLQMVMPQMGLGTVLQMPFEIGTLRFTEMHLMKQYRPTLAGVGDLIAMFQRGSLNSRQLEDYLGFHGYQEEFVNGFRELAIAIPSPQDLVRFLVKEAISMDTFKLLMAKQGYSEEISDNFWIAHWNLPSVGQVMEMYHRQLNFPIVKLGATGIPEVTYPASDGERDTALDEYLKIADYAPEWRPFIRDISYNIITRVDARRGWEMGLLDRPELVKIYRDSGYSPKDAETVTDIQIYATFEAERGDLMRKGQAMLIEGWIDGELLTEYLSAFIKREDLVLYRVMAAEREKDLNERADWVSIYIEQFRKETLNSTTLQAKLEELNMLPWRIEAIVSKELARTGVDVTRR